MKLNDKTMDMLTMVSLADGNPGCLQMLIELQKRWPRPFYGKLASILMALDICGEKAYLLWNDLCERDVGRMTQLLLDLYTGRIPLYPIRAALAEPESLRTLDLIKHSNPYMPWMEECFRQFEMMRDNDKRWEDRP